MALGTRRQRIRQEISWIAQQELPASAAHPFYTRLNELLDAEKFDEFAEAACKQFYAKKMGRPSLTPGISFRALLVGYFEGIDCERGIAWRASDSLGIRHFPGIRLDERSPDHSTLSRTRRLIDVETLEQVFGFVLRVVISHCPLKGAGIVEGQNHRRGRHDPRSQRGHAQHRSPGHRRQLPGVPDRIGPQVLTKELTTSARIKLTTSKTPIATWHGTTSVGSSPPPQAHKSFPGYARGRSHSARISRNLAPTGGRLLVSRGGSFLASAEARMRGLQK
ncbi:MAG: transposase [Acidobacteriota bacterium]